MLDTILFDWVGVLLCPKENLEAGHLAAEIDRQIGKVTNDVLFKEETLRRYQLRDDEFSQLLQTIADKYEPYTPLWELLPRLKKHYKLGIINNGTYLTYPLFEERYRISQHFDLFLSSAREGIRKPDPALYRLASQRLGSQPRNCLFMDDSAENILGAQQVGMQTIHWSSKEQGFQEFEKYFHPVTKTASTASHPNEPITSQTG